MNWFKRYALSCLIALFVFSGIDSYKRPDDMRLGAVVVSAAVWPVFVAIVLGSCAGDAVREINHGKA